MARSILRTGVWVLIPVLLLSWFIRPYEETRYPLIRDASIDSLQEALSLGSISSVDLVRTYLARISEVNPMVHAVAEINQEALSIAQALDEERKVRGSRRDIISVAGSKLHGIPILIKDSISAHGMNNTGGSCCLVGSKTTKEASLVTNLRAAGAIILGKANMSQWGNARSSLKTASNGWSSWGGQTYGVYHALQDPCGSSSGSAVSMALGLSAASIGVETVGSITCPAMRSNLVSIKPTSGLVARDNVIVTKKRGTIGPMARTVKDAATMLSFMAGRSPEDPASMKIPFATIPDYEASCKVEGLRHRRLGIPQNNLQNPIAATMNTTAVMDTFKNTLPLLKASGATIIDNANYPLYDEINSIAPQQLVGPAEYKVDWADYFRGLDINPYKIRSIEDMISCTESHPKEEYPSRDIAVWENIRKAEDLSSAKIVAAMEQMISLGGQGGIDGALDAAKADALVFPSIVSSDVPGLAGYPVVTVPLGFMPVDTPVKKNPRGDLVDEGPNIPYGLSFIGRPFSEQLLIELAYSFEQATKVASRRTPIILPKTELTDIVNQGTINRLDNLLKYLRMWIPWR